jgi:hypothetical protein
MMATTSAERMRDHRSRRRRREVQLTIEVSEADLREIALRAMRRRPRRTGRPRPRRSRYSSSDQCFGLRQGSVAASVTQRCVATVAPQHPRIGVTPRTSQPSTMGGKASAMVPGAWRRSRRQ